MNIHGFKQNFKKAREMLNKKEESLREESKKRGQKKNYALIDNLEFQINSIKRGMRNIRDKIEELRNERKTKKKKI